MDLLNLATHRINQLLGLLDPDAFHSHTRLRKHLMKMHSHVRGRGGIDESLFQGRSIIFNRATPLHFDLGEPPNGWTPIYALGKFQHGHIRFPSLGLRLWFGPGAGVFFHGRIFAHEIEKFEGGQRISIAHFCHQSVWRHAGITPLSTGLKVE